MGVCHLNFKPKYSVCPQTPGSCRWKPALPVSDQPSLCQGPGAAASRGGDREKAPCSILHLPPQRLQRFITALRIPEDFKPNYKTINQCSQDFGGHKKRVREDMYPRSRRVTPSFPAGRATSSLSSLGLARVPWVGGCPPKPPRSKR